MPLQTRKYLSRDGWIFKTVFTTYHRKWDERGVYFMRRCGLIKIGYAVSVRARLSTLRMSAPDGVVECLGYIPIRTRKEMRAKERDLHQRFAGDRVQGEWFLPSMALWFEIGESKQLEDTAA